MASHATSYADPIVCPSEYSRNGLHVTVGWAINRQNDPPNARMVADVRQTNHHLYLRRDVLTDDERRHVQRQAVQAILRDGGNPFAEDHSRYYAEIYHDMIS